MRVYLIFWACLLTPAAPAWAAAETTLDIGSGPIKVVVPDAYDPRTSEACCDFYDGKVDHVDYLSRLVQELGEQYNLDSQRIYFMGHSNGAFMAYRMACDRADLVAAVVSLAGAIMADDALCNPAEPVHVLQIHGTLDNTIAYAGGLIGADAYLGAKATTEKWALYAGCSPQGKSLPDIDLEVLLPGSETTVTRYSEGCTDGGSGELWAIEGGSHVPFISADFGTKTMDWLLNHSKPKKIQAANVTFNAGFNDAWRNEIKKGGQGVFLVVFPVVKMIFMSWFTYDLAQPDEDIAYTLGHSGHRWYTAFGPYDGDTAVLELELTQGGIFDSNTLPEQSIVGSVTLTSISCTELHLTYEIFAAGVSGEIPLGRALEDNVPYCESFAEQQ